MSFETILKMTLATAGYVLVTGLLWVFWMKKKKHNRKDQILVGLVFGACSVAANHFGIVQGSFLILNVRDIGPLSAGLFFSPVSGIIAGLIGGIERYLAAEIWDIGSFTKVACSLSTCLAGFFAAFLNKKIHQGKRPSMPLSFFLGAVTEVFHMYAVIFTNRDNISIAYYIVRGVALPMILFTAFGLAFCSGVIMRLSHETSDLGLRVPDEKIPITVLFQRALLVVTIGLFVFNFIVSYNTNTRMVSESAESELQSICLQKSYIFESTHDLEALKKNLNESDETNISAMLVNIDTGEIVAGEDSLTDYVVFDANDREVLRNCADKEAVHIKFESVGDIEFLCCASSISGQYYLVCLREMFSVFLIRDSQMYENTLSDILLFTVMYMLVVMLADRLVVRNLHRVNKSLHKITGGDLKEVVWVHACKEFTDLSEDINSTVTTLRGYIDEAEQRMKNELKLAATIQEASLPQNFDLPAKNIDIHALMTPAKEVGGDFYDFFYVGVDCLCLVIADVSGKGVPASLFMMRAKTAIKNYARSGMSPAEVLSKVNHTLCEGNDAEMFVTVWLGILNLKTGHMQCANAGHEYPVLMRADGNYELLKDRHGLVLAAMNGIKFPEYEIQMNPGDRIFVYTDGVPEAINGKKEAYGTDRLVSRLNRVKNYPQDYILKEILQDIRNFAGTAEQFDDITMMGLTYKDTVE